MKKIINNPNAEWHTWPNEVPNLHGREIHSYLVKCVGGLDKKMHYWICDYVQLNDCSLKGWYYNGNEFAEQEHEFLYMNVDELYSVEKEEEEEVPDFYDFCKDFILDEIDKYDGVVTNGCDLGFLLTEEMNANQTFTFSCTKTKSYFRSWEYEAGEYLEYENRNFSQRSNPFLNVDVFLVGMVSAGVRSILSRCEYVDKEWNGEFTLNESIIAIIKKQVEEQTDKKLF